MSTTTTGTGRCPACAGARLPGHPAGLVFAHDLGCPLLGAEDGRTVADVDRARRGAFTRPPTMTEVMLLAAFGPTLPPDAVVAVGVHGAALRVRRFVRTDTSGARLGLDIESGTWRPA